MTTIGFDEGPATAAIDPATLRAAIVAFAGGYSIETTPHEASRVDRYREFLPAGRRVYVAHPPRATLERVVALAVRLRELGYEPVPHVVARELNGPGQLDRALGALAAGGVPRVMLIAGDRMSPVGPYSDTLEVLATGLLEKHGIAEIGIAGHPEGSKVTGHGPLREYLRLKAEHARRTGASMHVVTQFGFDARAFADWERQLLADGIRLPIHVGFAGPANLARLLQYAMRCGIGASMRLLAVRTSAAASLVSMPNPDQLLTAIVRHRLRHPDSLVVRPHFFAFGGFEGTARWLEAVRAGAFELRTDGGGFYVRQDG